MRQFVGTESRLKRIIDTLTDLAMGSADVATRLEYLLKQRDELDAKIRALQAGATVERYHDTAIRERFSVAISDLIQLQGDFRAVEDRFKGITREDQKRQLASEATCGQILGEVLGAEDSLKQNNQGVSFNEFARLILSLARQEELERLIREVMQHDSPLEDADGLVRIRDMIPLLTSEARTVLRTCQRLSETLRRLLDRDSRGVSPRRRFSFRGHQ